MKEVFDPFFLVLSSVTNLEKQFRTGMQAIPTIILELIGAFFGT